MIVIKKVALILSRTRFGRHALAENPDLSVFKSKPKPRFYFGLGLIGASYLFGLAAMAIIGRIALQGAEKPLILATTAVLAMIVIHLVFAVGVYIAGGNYVLLVLRWVTACFLRKYLPETEVI